MELKLEKLVKIQQDAGKLIETAGLLENNFIKTREDFIQVEEVVASWMNQWQENLKLDIRHETMRGQLTDLVNNFELEQQFLENTFSERKEVLRKHFEVVDFAIENNDDELILETLSHVSEVVCQSPLKSFKTIKPKDKNTALQLATPIRFV